MPLLTEILLAGLFGLVGGLARSVAGLLKVMSIKMKLRWSYWTLNAIISGIIGILVGMIFSFDYRASALGGFAGLDVLEGIYKAFAVQKVYVPPSKR